MKKLALLALILICSLQVSATEVAVLDGVKKNQDFSLTFTDENVYAHLEKMFVGHPCKIRSQLIGMNPTVRESFVNRTCRGEILKFLLNAGYKSIDQNASIYIK